MNQMRLVVECDILALARPARFGPDVGDPMPAVRARFVQARPAVLDRVES